MSKVSNTKPGWYKIKNLAPGPAEVILYDEIGAFGISARDFINDLAGVQGPINMRLNSGGGEVFDGIAIYNALKSRPDPVAVTIDGIAASIASVIAMAASPGQLAIAKNASLMIHEGFSSATGNAAEMRGLADLLDQQSQNIASIYAGRTGQDADYWRNQMKTETWYVGQQAVDAGLADRMVDLGHDVPKAKVVKTLAGVVNAVTDEPASVQVTKETPAAVRDCPHCAALGGVFSLFCHNCGSRLLMAADSSGWVQDAGGQWRFDPDGDGDDDSTAEGDTDHDYFDADGKQIKEIPPCPGKTTDFLRTTILAAGMDNSPWDASKAWSNGADSDDPAAFYKGICAGRKSGDPTLQSSWALPYKYTPKSAPNAAAVRNALARIGQTQGLTNKSEAQSLLERLMKQINPDYDSSSSDRIDPSILQALLVAALEGANT